MKGLSAYSDTEKARLLHQLFPEEIPAFLEFTINLCQTIKEDEVRQREQWQNALFTFDFWLQLIGQEEDNIRSSGNRLYTSSSHFAVQLFEGYQSILSVYSLQLFTTTSEHPNPKFATAVNLFFHS